jgi:lysophospholipase L1-like esterase
MRTGIGPQTQCTSRRGSLTRRFSAFAGFAATLAAVAWFLVGAGPTAQGAPGHPYLALGDSVPFAFITQAGFEYGNPANFVGYADYVGDDLRLTTTDAACPGEATTSFISTTGADNGCRAFRASAPLHVSYAGTQFDFAKAFLDAHPNTSLVTIQIGANDLFLLEKACSGDPTCIQAGLPATLATISSNVDGILKGLRATGFHGVLMVVNYYSLDYSDPAGTAITKLLNQAETASANADGAVVADAFSAFQQAAASAGGKTCVAGLLNASPANQFQCDVHPSQSGHQLLAQTVEATYETATGG